VIDFLHLLPEFKSPLISLYFKKYFIDRYLMYVTELETQYAKY